MNSDNISNDRKAFAQVLSSLLDNHRKHPDHYFALDDRLHAGCPNWHVSQDRTLKLAYYLAEDFADQSAHGSDFYAPMVELESMLEQVIANLREGGTISTSAALHFCERKENLIRQSENSFVSRLVQMGKEAIDAFIKK